MVSMRGYMRKKLNKTKLDDFEKQLLDSYKKGEWKSAKDFEKQKRIAKTAAKNTLRKDARINI